MLLCYSEEMMRIFSIFLTFLLVFANISAQTRMGAERAYPAVSTFLEGIPFESGSSRNLTDDEVSVLIDVAARSGINVFEMLDCMHRYLAPRKYRAIVMGHQLAGLSRVDFGGPRVEALLPISKLVKIECGAVLNPSQRALDIFITEPHQDYIEIGTAIYETRFGFARMEPNLFADSYGITVKKLFFSAPLEKIEMYEPAKAAIYARGLSRPKRWVLEIIRKW